MFKVPSKPNHFVFSPGGNKARNKLACRPVSSVYGTSDTSSSFFIILFSSAKIVIDILLV